MKCPLSSMPWSDLTCENAMLVPGDGGITNALCAICTRFAGFSSYIISHSTLCELFFLMLSFQFVACSKISFLGWIGMEKCALVAVSSFFDVEDAFNACPP